MRLRAQRCPGAFLSALTPPVDLRPPGTRCGVGDFRRRRFAACSQAVEESGLNADTEAGARPVQRPTAITQSGETVGASASCRRASTSSAIAGWWRAVVWFAIASGRMAAEPPSTGSRTHWAGVPVTSPRRGRDLAVLDRNDRVEDVARQIAFVVCRSGVLQRLVGHLRETGDRRVGVRAHDGAEQRAVRPVGSVRRLGRSANEQPGRTGQATDSENTQTPPQSGKSRAALRSPLRPLDVRRQGREGTDGRRRIRRARHALDPRSRHDSPLVVSAEPVGTFCPNRRCRPLVMGNETTGARSREQIGKNGRWLSPLNYTNLVRGPARRTPDGSVRPSISSAIAAVSIRRSRSIPVSIPMSCSM